METKSFYSGVLNELISKLEGTEYLKRFKTFAYNYYTLDLTLDALNEEDVPHHIEMNSIGIEFRIDFIQNKVEVNDRGHVYLSKEDREGKYKYYAMKSIEDVLVDNGGKKFRRCKFKNVDDLCSKIQNYFVNVMREVDKYTGGYPYKN
jgi:hypothetical protein